MLVIVTEAMYFFYSRRPGMYLNTTSIVNTQCLLYTVILYILNVGNFVAKQKTKCILEGIKLSSFNVLTINNHSVFNFKQT